MRFLTVRRYRFIQMHYLYTGAITGHSRFLDAFDTISLFARGLEMIGTNFLK